MKTYKNLYPKLCSYENLEKAFRKASKGKNSKFYVIEFKKDLNKNLLALKKDLELRMYKPAPLKKFTVRDPKTRLIRKSIFKDRVVHHAVVNILEPIYEKRFIHDTYANRVGKGTTAALKRFDSYKRKISENRKLIHCAINKNIVKGYVFKADIRKYFDSVNQDKLIEILRRKIKDEKIIWLISIILKNFGDKKVGMPLGNMTSQFFANIYLSDLDYFVKRRLKMKYYIRYVDDFLILHQDRKVLQDCRDKIEKYLKNLRLELHPDKSKISPIYKGVNFLGFKIFYHYKLAKKRNVHHFYRRLSELEKKYKEREITREKFMESVEGWFAYIKWGNTYKLRKNIMNRINKFFDDCIIK